jgi:heme-degrading monooxygenase HmoA
MVVVIFEVTLKEGMKDVYLKISENLQSDLVQQDGFISIERFKSIHDDNKMVSIQIWKDEQAITSWRANERHRKVMPVGYNDLFEDYKLKVLSSIRSYSKYDRNEAPNDIDFIPQK